MTDKLLPCPFCGNDPAFYKTISGRWVVECTPCTSLTFRNATKEGAITEWNHRPIAADLSVTITPKAPEGYVMVKRDLLERLVECAVDCATLDDLADAEAALKEAK